MVLHWSQYYLEIWLPIHEVEANDIGKNDIDIPLISHHRDND